MPSRNFLDCMHPNVLYLQQVSDELKLSPNPWFMIKKLPYFLLKFSSAGWLTIWQRCFGCLLSGSNTRHDWYLFSDQVSYRADLYELQSFCFQNSSLKHTQIHAQSWSTHPIFLWLTKYILNFWIIPVAPKGLKMTITGWFSILFLISLYFILV